MSDDQKPSDETTPTVPSAGKATGKDQRSPQDEMMEGLPGASPPSETEAEGEGDGPLDDE